MVATNDATTIPVKHHEVAPAPEGITRAAGETTREHATLNKQTVATAAAERAVGDKAAVAAGVLPPQPEIVDNGAADSQRPTKTPADPAFNGMKPNEIQYGKDGTTRQIRVDADGTQHRIFENFKTQSGQEDIVHPDGSSERTTHAPGVLETQKWDKSGVLRDDQLNMSKTPDGKFNYTGEMSFDAKGNQVQGNNRWQDQKGEWHEDNKMTLADGTKIEAKMDGYRTDTKTTNPDGSWSEQVKTANVDAVDPKTGKHYKTMTIENTESQRK